MSGDSRLPGRGVTGLLLLCAIGVLLTIDLLRSEPLDPYQAPWPTALGSGQVPTGAHCTDSGIATD